MLDVQAWTSEKRLMVGKTLGCRRDRDEVSSGKQDRREDDFELCEAGQSGLDGRAIFAATPRKTDVSGSQGIRMGGKERAEV
jgi:hypothetical protein